MKQNNYVFKVLIFSGDNLIEVLDYEKGCIKNILTEREMKNLFNVLFNKHFTTNFYELEKYSFNENMPTNFKQDQFQYSNEVSYYLNSKSKLFSDLNIEEPHINFSLEYFHN